MSHAYLVMYEGKPDDPEAFLRYYVEHHIPIVWTFPKIRKVEVQRGLDAGEFFMITRLVFDTLDDLHTAMASPERERARADMANFPRFHGTVRRQIFEVLELPPRP
jgi:uncharacterized protein (TIGR02118 family)